MLKNKTQKIATMGLLLVLGILLPYVTGHAFGVAGTILLPMHIPVLLCGLICGPAYGAASGILIPVMSSLFTGMPALYPMLPIMAVQLVVMGLATGLLYQTWKVPLYPALILSMLAGWSGYGLMFSALLLANGEMRALSVSAALLAGIPGLVVQLTLVPILVAAVKHYLHPRKEKGEKDASKAIDAKDVQKALALIKEGQASCVVVRNHEIIHMASGQGVSPLLALYAEHPEKMKGALVVDRIIGKAAAMILVLGGVSQAYGMVMSMAGKAYLQEHDMQVEHGLCVDVISNRDQTGICPIERSVLAESDPEQGLEIIKNTIVDLRSGGLKTQGK